MWHTCSLFLFLIWLSRIKGFFLASWKQFSTDLSNSCSFKETLMQPRWLTFGRIPIWRFALKVRFLCQNKRDWWLENALPRPKTHMVDNWRKSIVVAIEGQVPGCTTAATGIVGFKRRNARSQTMTETVGWKWVNRQIMESYKTFCSLGMLPWFLNGVGLERPKSSIKFIPTTFCIL